PEPAGHRAAGGQGDRAQPAPLLAAAAPRSPVRRPGADGPPDRAGGRGRRKSQEHLVLAVAVSQSLRLRRGAELEEEPPALRHGDARLPLRASPAALDVLKTLRDGRLDPASLAPQPDLALMVSRLEASGWIARSVVSDGQTLATREPLSFLDVLTRRGLDPKVPVKLSRFAFMHVERGEVVLESGTARSFVVSNDPRLAGLVAALAEPRAANDLDPAALGLARGELAGARKS